MDIQTAAQTLQKLQPDVILLQGVKDWKMCSEFAQALKPSEYSVAVCSTFPPAQETGPEALQVAIIARQRAYFSWSEPWHSPEGIRLLGGYVFAVIQAGERRIGLFSTEIGEPQMPALTAQQILDQIEVVKHWESNQPQTCLIGCTFSMGLNAATPVQSRLFNFLRTGGVEDAFIGESFARKSTAGPRRDAGTSDFILLEGTGFSSHRALVSGAFSDHHPLLCDVELDPARVATARAAQAELARGAALAPAQSETNLPSESAAASAYSHLKITEPKLWAAGVILAALAILAGAKWSRSRRQPVRAIRTPARLPASVDAQRRATASSYTVVVAPRSSTANLPDAKLTTHPPSVIQIEAPAATQTQSVLWQQRALAAEEQARQAEELLRQGLMSQLSQWMKQKLVRKLIVDRAQLLEAQQDAVHKALKVDERLNRIEQQIRQQNQAYERRIDELNRELLAAKEESRELIRARIVQVKAEMETARARLLAKAQEEA